MASKYFKKALVKTSVESKIFVKKNLDITEQVYQILATQEKTQKDLAKQLSKSEAEVSRMLSGLHNLTLKTLAKLEAALGEEVIITPKRARERLENIGRPAKVISFRSGNLHKNRSNRYASQMDTTRAMSAYKEETSNIRIPQVSVKWEGNDQQVG